jgi:molybdopterin-guanine dinucleotide biosynthesis protein A
MACDMKYIIMCGGTYRTFQTPRQLTEIDGEPIIVRTLRLLREHGVDDIAISSNDSVFEQFGVPVLRHIFNHVIFSRYE